ncbi:hypothetical protein RJ641_013690, partial [Dillenia turbinata]
MIGFLCDVLRFVEGTQIWSSKGLARCFEIVQEGFVLGNPKSLRGILDQQPSQNSSNNHMEGPIVHPAMPIQAFYLIARQLYSTLKTIVTQQRHATHLANSNHQWEMTQETIPTVQSTPMQEKQPHELMVCLKIPQTMVDIPWRKFDVPILQVASLGHALYSFVNEKHVGSDHGSHADKIFVLKKPIKLKIGVNHIALLGNLVGLPNSSVYLGMRLAGVHDMQLGLNTGTIDLTLNGWGHKVDLDKEKVPLFMEEVLEEAKWEKARPGKALTWYKEKHTSMQQKEHNLWLIYLKWAWLGSMVAALADTGYYIPTAFLMEKKNLLVPLEEEGGNLEKIRFLTINRDTICSFIPDYAPPSVSSWRRTKDKFETVATKLKPQTLSNCPSDKFADYDDPVGVSGTNVPGKCHAPNVKKVVDIAWGRTSAKSQQTPPFSPMREFCPGVPKTLAIQV